jgi:hypothetical protein
MLLTNDIGISLLHAFRVLTHVDQLAGAHPLAEEWPLDLGQLSHVDTRAYILLKNIVLGQNEGPRTFLVDAAMVLHLVRRRIVISGMITM